MNQNQIDLAEELNGLPVGHTVQIGGEYITRIESDTELYEIQNELYCFIEAYDFLARRI